MASQAIIKVGIEKQAMSRFERRGELAGQEMYGGVGEPGELWVVLSHARDKI